MAVTSPDSRVPMADVARTLLMEKAAGEAWTALADHGIPAILLKGPAIAGWLYGNEVRVSRDVDLLVSPADFGPAQRALGTLGYSVPFADAAACEIGPNSQSLFGGGLCIDLHHGLIGVADPPERTWEVLSGRTVALTLRSGPAVAVLDLPARTTHLALHAAQSGAVDTKAIEDLRRGLATVPLDGWRAAAEVARELGATAPFAAGLRLLPQGREVADALGLGTEWSVELELRTTSAPREALFFTRMGDIAGLKAKAATVARKVWPTAAYLRAQSVAARGGPLGMLRARGERMVSLGRRVWPALTAWRRARARTGLRRPPPPTG